MRNPQLGTFFTMRGVPSLHRLVNHRGGKPNGPDLRWHRHRLFRRFGGLDPLLRKSHDFSRAAPSRELPLGGEQRSGAAASVEGSNKQGTAMNWVYWLSGLAALCIFVYLVVALFKPELFS
jgi:hypothetical protein